MLVPWLLVCSGELKTEQGHLTVRLARKAWLPESGREAALKVCTGNCITTLGSKGRGNHALQLMLCPALRCPLLGLVL